MSSNVSPDRRWVRARRIQRSWADAPGVRACWCDGYFGATPATWRKLVDGVRKVERITGAESVYRSELSYESLDAFAAAVWWHQGVMQVAITARRKTRPTQT